VVDYYERGKESPGYIKAEMCLSCEEASALLHIHAVKLRSQRVYVRKPVFRRVLGQSV
jgi:hypothetical protein